MGKRPQALRKEPAIARENTECISPEIRRTDAEAWRGRKKEIATKNIKKRKMRKQRNKKDDYRPKQRLKNTGTKENA